MLVKADNQPIISRPLHDSVWLTSLITPDNPDVMLKYQELTRGLESTEDRITALWRYVANLPYRETVRARITVNGRTVGQQDTWLFPSETIQVRVSNCANRSFLLTSLLKNELPVDSNIYCMLGHLNIDGIGAHAWSMLNISGIDYILETTQPRLERAFIPVSLAGAYDAVVAFDEKTVYTVDSGSNIEEILNAQFRICAIPFLEQYLCEKCLVLEV